jgi:ribonuclease P protein component
MLSKKERLETQDFKKVLKEGKTFRFEGLYLKFIPQKDRNISRFSVVVPKKNLKSAVLRHLVKRRIMSLIRNKIRNKKNSFPVGDYIIFTTERSLETKGDSLSIMVDQLLERFASYEE